MYLFFSFIMRLVWSPWSTSTSIVLFSGIRKICCALRTLFHSREFWNRDCCFLSTPHRFSILPISVSCNNWYFSSQICFCLILIVIISVLSICTLCRTSLLVTCSIHGMRHFYKRSSMGSVIHICLFSSFMCLMQVLVTSLLMLFHCDSTVLLLLGK